MYYRGWEATVNSQRVPVERVNYNLRGVELPPGNHKVEFSFRAPSFRVADFRCSITVAGERSSL